MYAGLTRRVAPAAVAGLALLACGAGIVGTPARSTPPAEDCADSYPVDALTRGQPVDGLTVARGTVPDPFAGEVIGVLENGIAPGIDMILADLANPTGDPSHDTRIDEVGGIWQGMSGSPVYSADGRLLGAVAYGLSWGPSTVAGITPYEQMGDYLPDAGAATRVPVPTRMARAIAASSEVSVHRASEGMVQLPMPVTINGLGQSRLRTLRSTDEGHHLHRQLRPGGAIGAAGPGVTADETDVVDGGNLGAAISYGTITMGGVGTVTDRCGDDVVGFGHPMMFRGRTSLGLMPADALQVQEESLGAPFKVVNLAAPVGTITQDRLTGITGSVGSPPPAMTATSKVTYGARDRTGESTSMLRDWNLDVTLTQMLAVHDVAIDAIQPGSKTATVRIDGTSGDDEPFRIRAGDRFVSDGDIALEGLWQTGDLLWVLSRIKGVDLTEVRTGADVVDSTDVLRLRSIQQRRHGGWVTLDRRHPARAQAGGDLRVRVQLRGPQGPRRLVLEVSVPARARGEGRLEVAGGSTLWNEALWEADTLAEVEKAVAREVRNDEVQARVDFWPRRDRVSRRVVSTPQELVVRGQRSVDVVVRR